MPFNIEIKARVIDFERKCALAEKLSGGPPQFIWQRDTFFPCKVGRLKLRAFDDGSGELIPYSRPDTSTAKQSDYSICLVASAEAFRQTLGAALGTDVEVIKRRHLYLVGQTRIHLDEVQVLGTFLELEVVLLPDQSAEVGHVIAAGLMRDLEVKEHDLLACAYADFLSHGTP